MSSTILITGAPGGVGALVARVLADPGNNAYLWSWAVLSSSA
ncbi:hypothetical protein AB0F46_42745 [Streptomyces sp. NPDC026665]